jgi:pseudouridine synthase
MRLNQYIAHSGLCSRREADAYIKDGKVTINEKPIESIAVMVGMDDIVKIEGKVIYLERKVYILLNKPKDYITTTDDEMDRKTVLDLVKPQLRNPELKNLRFYPVGRLDRNTSGLLLLTNDGELTQELTHPKFNIEKIYIANLDKKLSQEDADKITAGLELEDGIMTVDELAFPDPSDRSKIGISIHSGKNRIVRRIFEHLGYEVKQLDRIVYAGLTKKDLPRGKWRFLEPHELGMLKNRGKKTPHLSIQEKQTKRKKNSLYDSGPKKREFKPREKEITPPVVKEKLSYKEFRANDKKSSFKPKDDRSKNSDIPIFKAREDKFTQSDKPARREFKSKDADFKSPNPNYKGKVDKYSKTDKPVVKRDYKSKDADFKSPNPKYKGKDDKFSPSDRPVAMREYKGKDTEYKSPNSRYKSKEEKYTPTEKPSGKRENKSRIKEFKPNSEKYKSNTKVKSNEFVPKRKVEVVEKFEKPKVKPTRVQDRKLTTFNIPRTKSFSKKTK